MIPSAAKRGADKLLPYTRSGARESYRGSALRGLLACIVVALLTTPLRAGDSTATSDDDIRRREPFPVDDDALDPAVGARQ